MFHTFVTKYKKSQCCWAAKEESKFRYGKGKLYFEGEFKIGPLTQLDVTAIEKSRDGQFSSDKKSERKDLFGSPARNSAPGGAKTSPGTMVQTKIIIPASPEGSLGVEKIKNKKVGRVESWVIDPGEKRKKFLQQYCKLEEIHQTLIQVHDIHPPRSRWKDIFTVRCSQARACFKCRQCRMRFSQAAIALVAAQGTKDSVCLPYLGAVFRHRRYRNFSVEEWSLISPDELTMVFHRTSMQGQNANTVHFFLQEFAHKDFLPETIDDLSCFLGFGKKTACLLLDAMGVVDEPGIPVDRHLATGFRSLGWADVNESDETAISTMVECWLPRHKWGECNIVCAGLRQVWLQHSQYKNTLISVAQNLGAEHYQLLRLLCTKEAPKKRGQEENKGNKPKEQKPNKRSRQPIPKRKCATSSNKRNQNTPKRRSERKTNTSKQGTKNAPKKAITRKSKY
jgi:endonuclease III